MTLLRLTGRGQALYALRHRDYRLFWSGLLLSVTGFQVLMVAQGWLVYRLTEKASSLGLLGLASALPTILVTPLGGVVADRMDPRRLVMITQGVAAALTFLLGLLTFLGRIEVWHIWAVAFLGGVALGVDFPTRQALWPHLVERQDIPNAVALNSAVWQGTRIVGPSLGGVLIARWGEQAGFLLAALGFLAMAAVMPALRLPAIPRTHRGMGSALAEGVRYVRGSPLFSFLIGMSFFTSLFGLSYLFLLPVFARDILKVGAEGLGLLHAASGIGSLLMTFGAAALAHTPWRGPLLMGGAVLFGGFLVLFGYSTLFPLSLALSFLAGASSSLYMLLLMTTLQERVPNELRGRVMGLFGMTWSLMPLGALQSGFIADVRGAPFAVALGGVLVAAFTLLSAINPRLRRLGTEAAPSGD